MSGEIYLDGTVTPTSAAPIANDTDLFGGFRVVANAAARNAIPSERRTRYMRVVQADTGVTYWLSAVPPYAGTDADWSFFGDILDLYANRPATGLNGQRFRGRDGGPGFVYDSNAGLWRPELETTLGYEPPSAGWTVIDSGLGAVASFDKGVYELAATSVGSTNALSLAVRSLPGAAFDVKVRLRQIYSLRNSGGGAGDFCSGIVLRDSATGNMQWLHYVANDSKTKQINVATYTNATTYIATQLSQDSTQFADDSAIWMRVVDTPPTWRTYYISNDGMRWWQIYSIAYASRYPVNANQVGLAHQGFIFSGTGLWDSGVRLESWTGT